MKKIHEFRHSDNFLPIQTVDGGFKKLPLYTLSQKMAEFYL
jgi:hypothetical protein